MSKIEELSRQQVAGMTRQERIRAAKNILKRLSADQRRYVCEEEIPEICAFLEGKTSSCSTSCGPGSPELAELTEKLQVLASDLRRHGAAMNRKRREELRLELAKLDLIELHQRVEAAEAVA